MIKAIRITLHSNGQLIKQFQTIMSGCRGNKKAKRRFSHGATYLIQAGKMSLDHKAATLLKYFSASNIFMQSICTVKENYQINLPKAMVSLDRLPYAQAQPLFNKSQIMSYAQAQPLVNKSQKNV